MMTTLPSCGVDRRWLDALCATFSAFTPVEKAWIYGSRARGDFRAGSDIDLAVDAPTLSFQDFLRLKGRIDDLPIIFKIDLVHLDALEDGALKKSIRDEAIMLYDKNNHH